MKHERISHRKHVVDSIGEFVRRRREDPKKKSTVIPSVSFAVEEEVKQAMRKLAQESRPTRTWGDLLRKAVEISREELDSSLRERGEQFDFEPYLRDALEALKPVAKEIYRLQHNLLASRAAKRVHDKEQYLSEEEAVSAPYEVAPIGLLDSIDGYLASPTSPIGEVNLEALSQHFRMQGEWFPYEIDVDDIVFVLDDDGSIFVSTENFPREAREKARQILVRIATLLIQ
ncbi:MAG: hypothetical protein GXY83_23905 [Rhodopirellula sp.]|nr:hypothetical protein [Rhodopirellula sp.]